MSNDDLTTRQHERTQYLRCSTLGHAWFDVDSNHWTATYGTPFTARCERCGTERRDKLDHHGELIKGGRNYLYPAGYQYAKGERPRRSEFRLQLLQQRILEARAARTQKRSAS